MISMTLGDKVVIAILIVISIAILLLFCRCGGNCINFVFRTCSDRVGFRSAFYVLSDPLFEWGY